MKNRYFNENVLPVLLRVRSWRLVGSVSADSHSVALPRHCRWMLTHQHAHPYAEALIALEGTTVYGLDNRIYPCRPGTVLVFEPGQAHDNGYPPWTPAIAHLWISFMQDKAMARLIVSRQGRIHARGNIHCLVDLDHAGLWRQGTSSAFRAGLPVELIRLRLLAALAEVVATLVEEGYRDTAGDPQHRFQREKIEAICRHIRETGGADARLNHLAQIAGYSKFHFLRLFQRHTGQSIHAYVNQARLRKVEALLARGLALKAIAAELGFSCPAAFSRWYRPFRKKA
ncbi:MAG: AraC family transcriptional regulator [Kiritimatiellae bacterium]|nr:AraC family transcriptional regulator [Verrucomicrobiota bacterium]MCG2661003.1 AraC family transcriptional regulator [Kiritimatiellia bacterium]